MKQGFTTTILVIAYLFIFQEAYANIVASDETSDYNESIVAIYPSTLTSEGPVMRNKGQEFVGTSRFNYYKHYYNGPLGIPGMRHIHRMTHSK